MAYESHRVQNILFNSRKDLSPFLSSGEKPTKEDKLEEFEEKEQREK